MRGPRDERGDELSRVRQPRDERGEELSRVRGLHDRKRMKKGREQIASTFHISVIYSYNPAKAGCRFAPLPSKRAISLIRLLCSVSVVENHFGRGAGAAIL